mmetsp:Transcript_85615/g.277301  ORF Transcript_85615/g.277301 Transcript_85615/m.277301 type:complete len:233 (-) Transcript_85615:1851-2549(-)
MWALLGFCFVMSSCHVAFLLPLKAQSSSTRVNLPKAAVPTKFGSNAHRHAATVVPYLSLSDFRSSSSRGMLASIWPLLAFSVVLAFSAVLAPVVLATSAAALADAVEVSRAGSPCWPKVERRPGLESGDFGVAMKAGSPRCRSRVHSGSRSQIVINCFPGVGCRHLKSLWASCVKPRFSQASLSPASSMHSCGSFPNPNLQPFSSSPYLSPSSCRKLVMIASAFGSISLSET